jgi:enterochelin esterase family protein
VRHPDVFGNVISQSGSYWWSPESPNAPAARATPPNIRGINPDGGWLVKQIAESPRKNIRFYLETGVWEGSTMVLSNRVLRSVLVGKGYQVTYHEYPGNHSAYYWMLALPDALQASFGRP